MKIYVIVGIALFFFVGGLVQFIKGNYLVAGIFVLGFIVFLKVLHYRLVHLRKREKENK